MWNEELNVVEASDSLDGVVSRGKPESSIRGSGRKHSAKDGAVPHSSNHSSAKDIEKRKSYPLVRGLPKKQGAGGKGTWGKILDNKYPTALDKNDPNYDTADELENFQLMEASPVLSYKECVPIFQPVILEYFQHGDLKELRAALDRVPCEYDHSFLAVLAINLSMDKKDSERELVSLLVSDLFPTYLSEQNLEDAFRKVFRCLDDAKLDCPDAIEITAKFLARAVADDCVPPSFVSKHLDHTAPLARDAVRQADVLLHLNHGYARLDQVWGTNGGRRTVKMLTKNIILLLEEYLLSEDLTEVERCIRELDVPHFHHEIVYEAIYICININKDRQTGLLCHLLQYLYQSGIVTSDQMAAGFSRVLSNIQDILLDVPNAPALLDNFVGLSLKAGFVKPEFGKTLQRKRYLSEGDGGTIKAY